MKQQVLTYTFVVILGIIIGLLLYPVFFGKTELPIITVAPDSTFMSSEPDTFWVEQDTVYLPEYVYQDTGSTDIIIDTVYVETTRPVVVSYKLFQHSDFVLSEVWAKGPARTYSIDNSVVVDWQDHFDAVYKPTIDKNISKTKYNNLLKGGTAGALLAAGFMSGDWRITAGAMVASSAIVIIF